MLLVGATQAPIQRVNINNRCLEAGDSHRWITVYDMHAHNQQTGQPAGIFCDRQNLCCDTLSDSQPYTAREQPLYGPFPLPLSLLPFHLPSPWVVQAKTPLRGAFGRNWGGLRPPVSFFSGHSEFQTVLKTGEGLARENRRTRTGSWLR